MNHKTDHITTFIKIMEHFTSHLPRAHLPKKMTFFKVAKGIVYYIPFTVDIHLQALAISRLPCHQSFCEVLRNSVN